MDDGYSILLALLLGVLGGVAVQLLGALLG